MGKLTFRSEGQLVKIAYNPDGPIKSSFLESLNLHVQDSDQVLDLDVPIGILEEIKTFIQTGRIHLSSAPSPKGLLELFHHCDHLMLEPMPEIVDMYNLYSREIIEDATVCGRFHKDMGPKKFSRCTFSHASFPRYMSGTIFLDCEFHDCYFDDCDFMTCTTYKCYFDRCSFSEATVPSKMRESVFENCDFTAAKYLRDSTMVKNRFSRCTMRGFNVWGDKYTERVIKMQNCFEMCDLSGATLEDFVQGTCVATILSGTIICNQAGCLEPLRPTNLFQSTKIYTAN